MPSRLTIRFQAIAIFATSIALAAGCGTTRSSDTNRTATEQLLISDAIDRAVQSINLQTLAGQSVYLDDSRLGDAVDRNYLVSTLRQHLLASGCGQVRAERDQADYVVEARAGAIGTDRNDLLFGVPSMNVPQILPVQPVPAAIPEVPIAKRRDQRGIAKIAVFAYHRETGTPVWQSGIAHQESSSNDVWILGAGPFQRGTIYEGTEFAGKTLGSEGEGGEHLRPPSQKGLARERVFMTPQQIAQRAQPSQDQDQGVVPAVHQEPVSAAVPTKPNADPLQTNVATEQLQAPSAATEPSTLLATPAGAAAPRSSDVPSLIVPTESKNAVHAALSASVHEPQISRGSGSVDPSALFQQPVDPVPLPHPRLQSFR